MIRLAPVVALVLLACGLPSEPSGDAEDVRGNWRYGGTQSTPALTLDGTLLVTEQTGMSFRGTANLREYDVDGRVRSRSGLVSGRIVGGNALDFDLLLEEEARRHVARMGSDTLRGSWIDSRSAAGVSGSFILMRIR